MKAAEVGGWCHQQLPTFSSPTVNKLDVTDFSVTSCHQLQWQAIERICGILKSPALWKSRNKQSVEREIRGGSRASIGPSGALV